MSQASSRSIMDELLPSVVKDFLAVMTPYILFLTELVPTGIAIFSGVLGCLHLWQKYKLTKLQLKEEERKITEQKNEQKQIENV